MSIKIEEMLKFIMEEAQIKSEKIRDFVKQFGIQEIKPLFSFCQHFVDRELPKRNYGLVHQDLINILGEKLGFRVIFGDYQEGPDGIWNYGDVSLIIESKTSPTWLKIKQASDYVKQEKATSGLIISSDFTEDRLKAAGGYGNVRLLTTDGLCKLTELKEDVVGILIPQEAVKLDYFVDLIYKIRIKPEEVVKESPPEKEAAIEKRRFTPQREYKLPILEALIEMGGRGRTADVLKRVYDKMKYRLIPGNLERTQGGAIRWINHAQWERLRLVTEGYLKKDSPRGIWEISEKGRELYKKLKES